MNYTMERITGDNHRPGMPDTGYIVRYDCGDYGWKKQRCFNTEEEALRFCNELQVSEKIK